MKFARFVMFVLLALAPNGCSPKDQAQRPATKLHVVATLFPLYDMARAIGGEHADVTLLLPPGVEAHSFEPRAGDILRLNGADMFISTGRFMEPWAESLIKGLDNKRLLVIDASNGITLMKGGREHADDHGHAEGENHRHAGGMDPHIWLDFGNAREMVETILKGFAAKDPAHETIYRRNAAAYEARLADLDHSYRTGLAVCGTRTIIHGGHFAFGYLAGRYGLKYVSVYPASGDAEPNARQMAGIVDLIRSTGARALFYEELISPRMADTLAKETGVKLLILHAAHNVNRDELKQGVTFPALMERNLESLRQGLQCR
jgi:zinc transport system substrate-binding protein